MSSTPVLIGCESGAVRAIAGYSTPSSRPVLHRESKENDREVFHFNCDFITWNARRSTLYATDPAACCIWTVFPSASNALSTVLSSQLPSDLINIILTYSDEWDVQILFGYPYFHTDEHKCHSHNFPCDGDFKQARAWLPASLALDSARQLLYFSDVKQVRRADLAQGQVVTIFEASSNAWGLCLSPDGTELYFVNSCVHLLRHPEGPPMAIQHVLVTPKQRGLPYEQRILHSPEDAVLDVEENALLIAEPRFRVIVRCDLRTGELRVLAGAKGKFGMVDGPFSQARFCFPRGLCFDSKRRLLYVSDITQDAVNIKRVGVVRCINLRAGEVSTLAGTSTVRREKDEPGKLPSRASEADLFGPRGLCLDTAGRRLFVCDYLPPGFARQYALPKGVCCQHVDFCPRVLCIEPLP